MLKISALFHHSVKSCAGNKVTHLTIRRHGVAYDRQFMITDPNYEFLTQRREQGACTDMALIKCSYDPGGGFLTLNTPDMTECRVRPVLAELDGGAKVARIFNDRCPAVDQGDEAADWLSRFLCKSCRLVQMTHDFERLTDKLFSA